jgi:cupin superfamily acireductone dioxygenase involved in methionine salvage
MYLFMTKQDKKEADSFRPVWRSMLSSGMRRILLRRQTGAKVSIPSKAELKAILEKYNYQMPHLEDQVINRYIKEVAQLAGLTDKVEIETTKGGTPKKEMIEKYKIVHTHTALRTGATLMYLAGIDLYDIMKVTGHTTPTMLKKYIKADSLEVVEKLADKNDYFK